MCGLLIYGISNLDRSSVVIYGQTDVRCECPYVFLVFRVKLRQHSKTWKLSCSWFVINPPCRPSVICPVRDELLMFTPYFERQHDHKQHLGLYAQKRGFHKKKRQSLLGCTQESRYFAPVNIG